MNTRQLAAFLAIFDQGSFAKAADTLSITQSTVSARIRDLEEYFGSPLFDRTGRNAKLTPLGEQLLPFARNFVIQAQALENRFRDPTAITGTLRMGVVGVVANTWLPNLTEKIRKFHPNLSLRIDMSLTRILLERLRSGTLDLALVSGRVEDPALKSYSLGFDEFVWMVGKDFKIDKSRPLTPSDFKDLPLLSLSEDSYHYPIIDRWFREGGVPHITSISCNNMSVISKLTELGLGISLLPKGCYSNSLKTGQLVELVSAPKLDPVEFALVVRPDTNPAYIQSFLDAIKDLNRQDNLAPQN